MPIRVYELWTNKKLVIPSLSIRNSMEVTKAINWDEEKTSILNATLNIQVDPGMARVWAWIEHNLDEIPLWWWETDHRLRSGTFSVMTALKNGPNTFKFVAQKYLTALMFRPEFIVTASVTVEYSGEEPEEGLDWKKIAGYAAVGIGVVGSVITVGGALERKEK